MRFLQEDDPERGDLVDRLLRSNSAGNPDATNAIATLDWNAMSAGERARTEDTLVRVLAEEADEDRRLFFAAAKALMRGNTKRSDVLLALSKALGGRSIEVAREAVTVLETFGPDAHQAVPALLLARVRGASFNQDPALAQEAEQALKAIGEAGLPELQTALRSADTSERCEAALCIGQLGPKAQIAIPVLVDAANGSDASVHLAATTALKNVAPDALMQVAVIIARVRYHCRWNRFNEDSFPPSEFDDALNSFGPARLADLPALIQALTDPKSEVKDFALRAIARFGPSAKDAIPRLREILCKLGREHVETGRVANREQWKEEDQKTLKGALAALGAIGNDADVALVDIRTLIELAIRCDREVGQAGVKCLGDIGPASVNVLAELLTDKDEMVRGPDPLGYSVSLDMRLVARFTLGAWNETTYLNGRVERRDFDGKIV